MIVASDTSDRSMPTGCVGADIAQHCCVGAAAEQLLCVAAFERVVLCRVVCTDVVWGLALRWRVLAALGPGHSEVPDHPTFSSDPAQKLQSQSVIMFMYYF